MVKISAKDGLVQPQRIVLPMPFSLLQKDSGATSLVQKKSPFEEQVKKTTFTEIPGIIQSAKEEEVRDAVHHQFVAVEKTINESPKPRDAIVVVDPFSTGCVLGQQAIARGYECIAVHSDTFEVMKAFISHIPRTLLDRCRAKIYHEGSKQNKTEAFEDTVAALKQLRDVRIVAVLAGAETGVPLADRLSERLGVRTNKSSGSSARRNKYEMGEKIRAAGLRAVKQCRATEWSQIVNFIENDLRPNPFQVIIKPVESAGSDDVTLCHTMEEAKRAFDTIQGKINGLGVTNTAPLVQEYLDGTEYVVDTVSRDGKHKIVAMWEYDKRPANGAQFVYYGVLLRAVHGPLLTSIADYILKVLDALEIVNGPGHAEVKYVRGEPCLVEIGARCHGGEGVNLSISDRCIGYNQAQCTLDAYLDENAFNNLPDRPVMLHGAGCEVALVSYESGILEAFSGFAEAQKLPSFISTACFVHPNEQLTKTIDVFTSPASIMLWHENEAQVQADYERIRALEHHGMYKLRATLLTVAS